MTNTGSDRSQLANVAKEAKAVLQTDMIEAAAARGYFNGEEILACEEAGIAVTLPKPMMSGAKSEGRFGKEDFVYLPDEDGMGATHCLMKRLPKVASEMALSVLAYNLTRVMNIVGIKPLIAAIRA